jgi:uracil-DNA glycosylase
MDAKDRLRRYLEQRRELGESELVLDGLPVEDVMAMLSARPGAPRPRAARTDAVEQGPPHDVADATAVSPAPERAAEGSPADTSPAEAPNEPERRFDDKTSTDWRETLRRAGAMKPVGEAPSGPSKASADAPVPAQAEGNKRPRGDDPPAVPPTESHAPQPAPSWLVELGIPLGIASGDISPRALAPEIGSLPTLDAIAELVRACTRCDLYKTAINPVPGEGNPDADFVCVGEAPGQNEDEQGRPFVGASGALLNKILGAIGLQRDDVFICNVLKHRPPGNRDPLPNEVAACEPYLRRQLELLRPRVILALGRFAAQSLLQTATPISKLRGHVHRYHGIPLVVTYHPAALLRNESWKRPTWEDVKLARRILDASRAASPS